MAGVWLTELQLVVANRLDDSSQDARRRGSSWGRPPNSAVEILGADPKFEGERTVENLRRKHVSRLVDVDCPDDDEVGWDRPLLVALGFDPLAMNELEGGYDRLPRLDSRE